MIVGIFLGFQKTPSLIFFIILADDRFAVKDINEILPVGLHWVPVLAERGISKQFFGLSLGTGETVRLDK